MKLLKFSFLSILTIGLLLLLTPILSIPKTEAVSSGGPFNLVANANNTTYLTGTQIYVTASIDYTGSCSSCSKRLRVTGKLYYTGQSSLPEYTIFEQSVYGYNTVHLSGGYYFTAPAVAGDATIQIHAYDSDNSSSPILVDQLNITGLHIVLPAPVVTVWADSTNIPYSTGTTIHWSATNSPYSCIRSDTGAEIIGTTSFSTGNLTATKTFTVTCYN